MMKYISALLSLILLIAILAGCSSRNTSSSEMDTPSQTASSSKSQSAVEGPEPNEPEPQQPAAEKPDTGPEESDSMPQASRSEEELFEINGTKFFMSLPERWEANSDGIYEEDRKIAEILGIEDVSNADAPFQFADERYSGAVSSGDYTTSRYTGKFYRLQKKLTESGVTFKSNEIVYCLQVEDKIVLLAFYPAHGVGIGTQREEFEGYLNTVEFSL